MCSYSMSNEFVTKEGGFTNHVQAYARDEKNAKRDQGQHLGQVSDEFGVSTTRSH